MMKLTYTKNNVALEVVAETQKEIFAQLASAQEIFMEPCCAQCGGEYKFQVRTVNKMNGKKPETYEYPELVCLNKECRAKLSFGTHQEGSTLFPKRGAMNEETGKYEWFGKNGWVKFDPNAKKDS